ncbi:glycosyltransferase family 4 protein [Actinoplanes auranticolor]|nr:glycosyltransferase family 4 protein [Actinoplanes auranticolor]
MKILLAAPYFAPRTGGMETYAWHLAQGLRAAGAEVVVVCGDDVPSVRREHLDGLVVYRLPIWRTVSNTPVHPAWPWLLRRILRAERPDVVNAHTPVVFMVDAAALAVGRVPLVVTYHAATLDKPGGLAMRATTLAYRAVQRLTLGRADAVVAVSPYVRDALGRWADKLHVVPNAVPAVAAAPPEAIGDGLAFVASLQRTHSWKGLDLLLDALERYRRRYGGSAPRLTVVGDGDDRPRYERRVKELGLTAAVTFTGRLPPADRDRVLRGVRALVACPSTANDAFPTVLLEAWAQGVPVVATAIGALPSLVAEGRTGALAQAGDPDDLARVLHEVLTDPELARTLGENGRQRVAAEYTWPTQARRMINLLAAVAGPRRR